MPVNKGAARPQVAMEMDSPAQSNRMPECRFTGNVAFRKLLLERLPVIGLSRSEARAFNASFAHSLVTFGS